MMRRRTIGLLFAIVAVVGSPAVVASNGPAKAALPAGVSLPPLPPLPKSPVDLFRELLAMSPVERRLFLTNRPPETRKLILAKIREYESLRPEVRELRLQVTDLRWHLLPLMRMPATNRAAYLEAMSPEQRKLVQGRLQMWDVLPPPLQKELLENEAAMTYFSELESTTAEQQREALDQMSPARRKKLEEGIAQWQALPIDQRRTIAIRFQQFFELTSSEKARALGTLSEAERQQIDKTLRRYSALPPARRAECLRSFEKFASLSVEERQQFLKNAERWKLMSPGEREAWRDLVNKLSLLPPSRGLSAPALPPMPAPRRLPAKLPALSSTN